MLATVCTWGACVARTETCGILLIVPSYRGISFYRCFYETCSCLDDSTRYHLPLATPFVGRRLPQHLLRTTHSCRRSLPRARKALRSSPRQSATIQFFPGRPDPGFSPPAIVPNVTRRGPACYCLSLVSPPAVCRCLYRVCVLPIDIQHNTQCPCRFFVLERDTSSAVTKPRHRGTTIIVILMMQYFCRL